MKRVVDVLINRQLPQLSKVASQLRRLLERLYLVQKGLLVSACTSLKMLVADIRELKHASESIGHEIASLERDAEYLANTVHEEQYIYNMTMLHKMAKTLDLVDARICNACEFVTEIYLV